MKHVTYGDYSHIHIGKVFCKKCGKPIKKYNLQLLLSQDDCLCPACIPIQQAKPEKSNGPI